MTAPDLHRQDSYGAIKPSYATLDDYWQIFNWSTCWSIPGTGRNPQSHPGDNWGLTTASMHWRFLTESQAEPENAYTWFNLGSNLVYFERYAEAASAYDTARNLGLPQRMLRYQFGPFFAYFHAALTNELLAVTDYALQRTPNAEEALLWHGWALYRLGRNAEALADWQKALENRPGYQDAQYAIDFVTEP
jgi:tetratricopeptide (TPR) repeat protein